ncbi:MAG: leucine-rich repeat protein [Paludibacteraceae bacterium]
MKSNLFLTLVACLFCASTIVSAETVNVVYNPDSGINGASSTATLDDGTVLGFEPSGEGWYFVGAITSRDSLYVPEGVIYDEQTYPITGIGQPYDEVDVTSATNLVKLSLSESITNIRGYIPSQITDLYLNSTTPPSLNSYDDNEVIPSSTMIWVPQDAYSSYLALTNNSYSKWYGKTVDYVGHEYQSLTLTINIAGTLANELLANITQWSDVNELTIIGHLSSDDMKMFARLTNLTKLDLSQTDITTISNCNGLKKLTTIVLPSTLTEIGDNAFTGCRRLTNINCPNVTTLGNYAFQSCSSLTSISLPMAETIGENAFYYCSYLTSLSLPMAETIGENAFYYCSYLTSLSLPMAETIGENAFGDCSFLTSISLPNVTTLGNYAFQSCSSLTSISLPKVETIGGEAFRNCLSLTSISLPMAETIGGFAFGDCSSLTSISLPKVETIGGYAFGGCSSLTSISLPKVETIDGDAFGGTALRDVYCEAVSPFSTSAFPADLVAAATLHVPAISVTSYMLHDDWYHFGSIVPMDGELNVLALNSDFSLNTMTGLADSIDMKLSYVASSTQAAHVNVNVPITMSHYEQNVSTRYVSDYYYDENGNYVSYRGYPYFTTLIPQATMSADTVSLNLTIPTRQWQFISFPFDVNVSDIEVPEGVLWVIRKYSGADRAAMTGNTWQNMSDGSVLNAGEGYILHCTDNNPDSWSTTYITFSFKAVNNANKNNIFAYQAVSKPLNEYVSEFAHNRSWNLVGNPYPAFYNTQSMSFGAPITVWNGNGYTAYSLLDDEYVLRPFEAFFVQRPTDAASITFQPEGRTHSSDFSYDNGNDDYYAPRRAAAQADRMVYNFTFSGNDYTDKARLVINESARMEYEISCDASKMMSTNTNVPQLFIRENGIRMAIDERPFADGTATLGIYVGQSGSYTLALQSIPMSESVMLTDTKTNTVVDLSLGDYTFDAGVGTEEGRFIISIQRKPTEMVTIESGIAETDEYEVYTIDGRLLMSGNGAELSRQLNAGIYILRSQNSIKKVMVK